jgi:hypothetical protein
MGAIPLHAAPEAPRGAAEHDPLVAALDAVAVRAAVTRMARAQDWGAHAERVERWCWAALGDALDDLASVAPGRYGEEARRRHAALLDELRADLGLAPSAEG